MTTHTIDSLKNTPGNKVAVETGTDFVVRVKEILSHDAEKQKLRLKDSTGEINVTLVGGDLQQGDLVRYVGTTLAKYIFHKDGTDYPYLKGTQFDFQVVDEEEARRLDKTNVKLIEHFRICGSIAEGLALSNSDASSTFATIVIQTAQQGIIFDYHDLTEALTIDELEELHKPPQEYSE